MSGDVHHAYLTEIAFPRDAGVKSHVYQAVCSPFRNPLDGRERRAIKAIASKPLGLITGAMARAAGVRDPGIRWRYAEDPTFANQVATLEWKGREAEMKIEKTVPGNPDRPKLDKTLDRKIA